MAHGHSENGGGSTPDPVQKPKTTSLRPEDMANNAPKSSDTRPSAARATRSEVVRTLGGNTDAAPGIGLENMEKVVLLLSPLLSDITVPKEHDASFEDMPMSRPLILTLSDAHKKVEDLPDKLYAIKLLAMVIVTAMMQGTKNQELMKLLTGATKENLIDLAKKVAAIKSATSNETPNKGRNRQTNASLDLQTVHEMIESADRPYDKKEPISPSTDRPTGRAPRTAEAAGNEKPVETVINERVEDKMNSALRLIENLEKEIAEKTRSKVERDETPEEKERDKGKIDPLPEYSAVLLKLKTLSGRIALNTAKISEARALRVSSYVHRIYGDMKKMLDKAYEARRAGKNLLLPLPDNVSRGVSRIRCVADFIMVKAGADIDELIAKGTAKSPQDLGALHEMKALIESAARQNPDKDDAANKSNIAAEELIGDMLEQKTIGLEWVEYLMVLAAGSMMGDLDLSAGALKAHEKNAEKNEGNLIPEDAERIKKIAVELARIEGLSENKPGNTKVSIAQARNMACGLMARMILTPKERKLSKGPFAAYFEKLLRHMETAFRGMPYVQEKTLEEKTPEFMAKIEDRTVTANQEESSIVLDDMENWLDS